MIFDYFSGKIRLFLRSLWRALQNGNSPVGFFSGVLLFYFQQNTKTSEKNMRGLRDGVNGLKDIYYQ